MREALHNTAIQAAVEAGQAILEIYHSDDFQVTEKEDHSPLTKADRAAHNVIVSYLERTDIPILSEEGRDIPFSARSGWEQFWLVDPLDGTKEFIKRNGEFTVNIALIVTGVPAFGVVYAPVLEKLYTGIPGEGAWMNEMKGKELASGEITNQAFVEDTLSVESIRETGVLLPVADSTNTTISSFKVVASRSHLNADTEEYLEQIREEVGSIEIVSKGSSLKLCMVATGDADVYPRLGPTMEWDVAAAHAVVAGAGKQVFRLKKAEKEAAIKRGNKKDRHGDILGWQKDGELRYNKENLLNPYFLVT